MEKEICDLETDTGFVWRQKMAENLACWVVGVCALFSLGLGVLYIFKELQLNDVAGYSLLALCTVFCMHCFITLCLLGFFYRSVELLIHRLLLLIAHKPALK